MKKGIHPENYRPVVFKDMSNGDMFLSRSTCKTTDTVEFEGETYPVVKLEISNTSHPFYTGKSKLVDTAGRVDRFMSRYAKSTKNIQDKQTSGMRQRVVAYARWRISFSLKSSTMQYKHLLPALILTLAVAACSDDDKLPHIDDKQQASTDNKNQNPATVSEWQRLEVPRIKNNADNVVLVRTVPTYGVNYILEYDRKKRSQRWACFQWYDGNSGTGWNRNNWNYETSNPWVKLNLDTYGYADPFQPDPDLPLEERTELEEYYTIPYQRGHIVASADRVNSKEANEQTFYLSNIMPQRKSLNEGIWQDMESQLRTWNSKKNKPYRETLYVCKGGTIDDGKINSTTATGLIVPKYFFMAIMAKVSNNNYKALAFWVEHTSTNEKGRPLKNYVKSIDELEQLTGIDFFCNLSDDIEDKVEKSYTLSDWGL